MEERLKILIFNLKLENRTLEKEIEELRWRLKYSPSMCASNTKDLLKEKEMEFNFNKNILKRLNWVKETEVKL